MSLNASRFIFMFDKVTSIPMQVPAGGQNDNHLLMIRVRDWNGGSIVLQTSPQNTFNYETLAYDNSKEYLWNTEGKPIATLTTDDGSAYITQEDTGHILVTVSQEIFNTNINYNLESLRLCWLRCILLPNKEGKLPKGVLITLN